MYIHAHVHVTLTLDKKMPMRAGSENGEIFGYSQFGRRQFRQFGSLSFMTANCTYTCKINYNLPLHALEMF